MGIRTLRSYIKTNSARFLTPIDLQTSKLVIDGDHIFLSIYKTLDRSCGRYGAKYGKFANFITNWLENFQSCNIEPIIVINGMHSITKNDLIQHFKDKVITNRNEQVPNVPPLLPNIFISIVQRLKIKLIQTVGGARETIVVIAKMYDCPVLSNNSDFFIHGVKLLVNPRFVPIHKKKSRTHKELVFRGRLFHFDKFQQAFNNINVSVARLMIVLLGGTRYHDFIDKQLMIRFTYWLNKVTYSAAVYSPYANIERTLMWLSRYTTVKHAIADFLGCIDKKDRKEVLHTIEKYIQRFSRPSATVLQHLCIDDNEISALIAEHKNGFVKFKDDLNTLTVPKILWIPEDDHEVINEESEADEVQEESFTRIKKYEQFLEHELYEKIPRWLIHYHTEGIIRGYCIEMLMYRAVFLHPQCEYTTWQHSADICIPILTAMFSLMTSSCRGEYNILKVYTNDESKIVRKKIYVRKSVIQLDSIMNLELNARRAILNQALDICPEANFDEIPHNWKLYILTIVFWMKEKNSLKKNLTHLRAVLAAFSYDIVRSKMNDNQNKNPKRKSNFFRQLPKGINVTTQKPYILAVMSIKYSECVSILPFFDRHINAKIETNNDLERAAVVNTFGQLDICLKYSMEFNGLLRFPYTTLPIDELSMGHLFHNLYKTFQEQKYFYYFLTDCFQHAPNVLNSFLSLERIVRKAIEK